MHVYIVEQEARQTRSKANNHDYVSLICNAHFKGEEIIAWQIKWGRHISTGMSYRKIEIKKLNG